MKLGVPLVIGCVMIASLVVVQATAITAILGLVRRQVPRRDTLAQWVHSVGVFTRALLLIVAAQVVQIAAWATLFVGCGEFDDFSTAFYHSAMNSRPSATVTSSCREPGDSSGRWRPSPGCSCSGSR